MGMGWATKSPSAQFASEKENGWVVLPSVMLPETGSPGGSFRSSAGARAGRRTRMASKTKESHFTGRSAWRVQGIGNDFALGTLA